MSDLRSELRLHVVRWLAQIEDVLRGRNGEYQPPTERLVQVFGSMAYAIRDEEKPEWLLDLERKYGIR